jgi:hypothetical protein
MSKDLKNTFKFEVWIPFIFGVVIQIIILTYTATKITTTIEGKINLLTQALNMYTTSTDNLTLALNKVESHMCTLDTMHKIPCIDGGN